MLHQYKLVLSTTVLSSSMTTIKTTTTEQRRCRLPSKTMGLFNASMALHYLNSILNDSAMLNKCAWPRRHRTPKSNKVVGNNEDSLSLHQQQRFIIYNSNYTINLKSIMWAVATFIFCAILWPSRQESWQPLHRIVVKSKAMPKQPFPLVFS